MRETNQTCIIQPADTTSVLIMIKYFKKFLLVNIILLHPSPQCNLNLNTCIKSASECSGIFVTIDGENCKIHFPIGAWFLEDAVTPVWERKRNASLKTVLSNCHLQFLFS